MFDHVGIRVSNVAVSACFYEAALAPLGCELCSQDAASAGFGPPGAPALWLVQAPGSGGTHVAFRAADRSAVELFYKRGLEAGGRDNGAPGLRTDYGPSYYAAFLLDPDGNNVEAVCLR
jgi:catechol 2,3-dioxygenase-like lactoylglutathione lyase family enzyme